MSILHLLNYRNPRPLVELAWLIFGHGHVWLSSTPLIDPVMDALPHRGRDDSIVTKPPWLIETSNDGFEMESPVFRLPNELTMLIFQQFKSYILCRLTLTHTCRRWRHIAVNDASLWTNIHIQTTPRRPNARLNHFLSFLGMQLDRTANLPLDVEWYAQLGDDFFVGTLQLIRERAPFSRWRTLKVHISAGSQEDAPWSSVDTFTNLESLLVWPRMENTIISAIDRTITSRLKVLDLETWSARQLLGAVTSFAKSFTHISSLLVWSINWTREMPFPSANVVNLHIQSGDHHQFPHIETYNIRQCNFDGHVDLRSMTTLIVRGPLTIRSDCQVVLPALRELKLVTIWVSNGARIEAPSLDVLHFMYAYCPGLVDETLLSCTDGSLLDPGYLLSPNISITADSHLPTTTVITLLAKSPKVTHATLRFDNWADAHVVLERLVGFKTETGSYSVGNGDLCPRLSELRLDFDWEVSDPSAAKEWLLDALKSRKEASVVIILSIYVCWKGEGTYVLLTGC